MRRGEIWIHKRKRRTLAPMIHASSVRAVGRSMFDPGMHRGRRVLPVRRVRLRLAHRKRACRPQVFIAAAEIRSTRLTADNPVRPMTANVLQSAVSSVATAGIYARSRARQRLLLPGRRDSSKIHPPMNNRSPFALIFVALICASAATGMAQGQRRMGMIGDSAPVTIVPERGRTPLATLPEGTQVQDTRR